MGVSTKKKILLLDDDPAVGRALQIQLKHNKAYQLISPDLFTAKGAVDTRKIVKALSDEPDIILVDLVWIWQGKGSASRPPRTALKKIFEDRALDNLTLPLRVLLVTGVAQDIEEQKEIAEDWQQEFQGKLNLIDVLSKPLEIDQILALIEEDSQAVENLEFDLSDLPLPARILNADRIAKGSNEEWNWHLNDPPPGNRSDDRYEFSRPDRGERQRDGGDISEDEVSRFLRSYRLHEMVLTDNRVLQFAVELPNYYRRTEEELLRQIFDLLRGDGFTRMRFYRRIRIPGHDGGILRLEKWFGTDGMSLPDNCSDESLPWHPLGGYLLTKLMEHNSTAVLSFIDSCVITEPTIEEAALEEGDAGLQYWNKIVGTKNLESWVEVPILRQDDSGSENKYKLRAVLVVDRYGKENSRITETDLKRSKVSFESAVSELTQLINHDFDQEKFEVASKIQNFTAVEFSVVSSETNRDSFFSSFLNFACELVDAPHGILYWTENEQVSPVVKAIFPAESGDYISGRSPGDILSEEFSPIAWQAWKTGESVFWPEAELKDYRQGERHSRYAIPLRIGDRVYGSLAMMNQVPFHFTERRVQAVQLLVESCIYQMQFAGERADRRLWELVLVHEFGHELVGLRDRIEGLSRRYPDIRKDTAFKDYETYVQRIEDLARIFIAVQNIGETQVLDQGVNNAENTLDPDEILNSSVKYIKSKAKDRGFRICYSEAESRVNIFGHKETFGIIIRTLLHNAVHHGEPGEITVVTVLSDGFWEVNITNFGQMSDEENRLKYSMLVPRQKKKDGSHIGLPAALHWCRQFRATLSVNNIQENHVRAVLRWPTISR